jgi:signal transduction histidine kinase/DNA-binding response OmpR family regulator
MHRLLQRQLAKHFGDLDQVPEELGPLLAAIDEAYESSDDDRRMMERSLELSSRELLQANAEIQAVLSAFPDLFLWLDHEGRILQVQASEPLDLFLPQGALVGLRVTEIPMPAVAELFAKGLAELRSTRKLSSFQYQLSTNEVEHDYEARLVPLVDGQALVIIRNMTELKLKEKELRRAVEAAKVAIGIKSDFLATMSHELRTPMHAIIGMTSLLLNSGLTDEQLDFAKTVRSSGAALLTLINDILDFSKLEAGRLDIEELEFDVRKGVDEVIEMVAEGSCTAERELVVTVDPQVPRVLAGDPARLRQVLLNLISNAIKFTARGQVAARVSVASSDTFTTWLRCEVQDTGVGIDVQVQEQLFRPFTQADSSTTRRFGGTGLGLAISKRIVEAMGGRIGVESTLGEGSLFWFEVPLRTRAARSGIRGAGELGIPAGLRALVIDDNPASRNLIHMHLHAHGLNAEGVGSASDGLAALRRGGEVGEGYDLVLVDQHLPGMDGVELVRTIRRDPTLGRIPLVMLASDPRGMAGELAEESGPATTVGKPVRERPLLEGVRSMLGIAAETTPNCRASSFPGPLRAPLGDRAIRVLMAEDNLINQKVACRILERMSCEVVVVADGEAAVSTLEDGGFDVVLMDIQMPVMDGLEATSEIRGRELRSGRSRVPIIALTANVMPGDEQCCLDAGMDGYLAKPFQPEDLARLLRRWIGLGEEVPGNGDPMDGDPGGQAA